MHAENAHCMHTNKSINLGSKIYLDGSKIRCGNIKVYVLRNLLILGLVSIGANNFIRRILLTCIRAFSFKLTELRIRRNMFVHFQQCLTTLKYFEKGWICKKKHLALLCLLVLVLYEYVCIYVAGLRRIYSMC